MDNKGARSNPAIVTVTVMHINKAQITITDRNQPAHIFRQYIEMPSDSAH